MKRRMARPTCAAVVQLSPIPLHCYRHPFCCLLGSKVAVDWSVSAG